jgi:hypothetical protein
VDCGDGFKIDVVALDTSSSGLKLQCNAIDRELLTPRGEWTRHGKPIEVTVTLNVPLENKGINTIKIDCAVAYSRRVALDCYHVGLSYKNLDHESISILAEFINARLKQDSASDPN